MPQATSSGDRDLLRIVDAAAAQADRKAGAWLTCRAGCAACCFGPFPITQLDALRLRRGLARLKSADPRRAARVSWRARDFVARTRAGFPGNPVTGILGASPEAEAAFETFADDDPCPALDPATGQCDLYEARPITCRTFGPAMSFGGEALAICELCFPGAGDDEIAACTVEIEFRELETGLVRKVEEESGVRGETIVAFALALGS